MPRMWRDAPLRGEAYARDAATQPGLDLSRLGRAAGALLHGAINRATRERIGGERGAELLVLGKRGLLVRARLAGTYLALGAAQVSALQG